MKVTSRTQGQERSSRSGNFKMKILNSRKDFPSYNLIRRQEEVLERGQKTKYAPRGARTPGLGRAYFGRNCIFSEPKSDIKNVSDDS